MCTARPKIQHLTPIVTRLEIKLTSISSFLSQGARLQLVDSALSSMSTFFLCSIQIPPGILNQLNRIFRQCLWRDNIDTPKKSLATWEMICKPKNKGGVGIVNFQKHNEALLLKFLDKFYNNADTPWVNLIWRTYYQASVPQAANLCGSFWWKDVCKYLDKYRQVATVLPGKGDSFLFWLDSCKFENSTTPLNERYQRIFSYALDDKLTAEEVYEVDISHSFSIYHCLHKPMRNCRS
jgi:hypothetical protein